MMPMTQMVMLGELGHAIGGPMITREQQAKIDALSDEERVAIDRLPDAERLKVTPTLRRADGAERAKAPCGRSACGRQAIRTSSRTCGSRRAACR